jgi:hypothetical protein
MIYGGRVVTTEFLRIRLSGGRFTEHALPLELLADLAAINKLLVDAARWKFLEASPNRRRAPKRFFHGTTLALARISQGSAIAEIELHTNQPSLMPGPAEEALIAGRNALLSAISAAEHAENVDGILPPSILAHFSHIGNGLRTNETMEFQNPLETELSFVRLHQEARQRLLHASRSGREYTEDTSLWGRVPEADQKSQTFRLELMDGTPIRAPLLFPYRQEILDVFHHFVDDRRLRVFGLTRFGINGKPLELLTLEDAEALDPLDVRVRLDELRALQPGWCDGEGVTPPAAGLDEFASAFESEFAPQLPLPRIYPTLEGGLSLEWASAESEVSIEVRFPEMVGRVLVVHPKSGEIREDSLILRNREDWVKLGAILRQAGLAGE